jgi:hypothetical protein
MNVEIGAAAALFPEKEYISGIFVADVGCAGISKALLSHSSHLHPIPNYIENRRSENVHCAIGNRFPVSLLIFV